jgi:hypothetical protein
MVTSFKLVVDTKTYLINVCLETINMLTALE